MLTNLRRVGFVPAVTVTLVMAGLTYLGLTLVAGTDDDPPAHVLRADAPRTKPTPARGDGGGADSVGGIDVTDGKVVYHGKVKAPEPGRKATKSAAAAPAPAAQQTTGAKAAATSAGSLAHAVGQLIITPVAGLTADAPLLARIRAGQVGGVILFGNNINTTAQIAGLTKALQRAARAAGRPGLLIMTDQEGGTVKRLQSQPPSTSAAQMGAAGTAATEGAATGEALARLGINVDLAPVADIPTTATNFLGTRAFGRSSAVVGRSACSFAGGLHEAGVGSSLKHFPGLGRASGNTDARSVRIQATQAQLSRDLAPYRRCASEPGNMVMISNAAYSGLTGTVPAVISPNAYGLLRSTLGFGGTTISDSLNANAVNGVPDLAVKAAAAGLDLQLWTSVPGAEQAYNKLLGAATSGALSRTRVREAAARVHQLKQSLGLV